MLSELSAETQNLNGSVAVVRVITLAGVIAMVTMLLVEDFGLLKRMTLTGNTG